MKIIGDGGHAAVVREIINPYEQDRGYVFVAVGGNAERKKEAEKFPGYAIFDTLIHPSAVVSPSATIGAGTVIMAGVVVQAYAQIGRHVILNTHCSVDHHAIIGDYVHIAPGAHLCGSVEVGEGALVGVGVGIAPGCKISAWSLVKAIKLEIVPLNIDQDYGLVAGRG